MAFGALCRSSVACHCTGGRTRPGRRKLTRTFQMSTHCHPPSPGVLYGTLGVPIGIIVIGPFLLPLPCALYKQENFSKEDKQ
jgi:hypothetical protein